MKIGSAVKYPSASWVQEAARLPDGFADDAIKNGGVLGIVTAVDDDEELVRVYWLDDRIFGHYGERWIYCKRLEELVNKKEVAYKDEEDRWEFIERGLEGRS